MSHSTESPFELYHRKAAPYDLVHAIRVTSENADAVSAITQGTVTHNKGYATEWAVVTFLGPGKTGVHDAEVGDYVVSDLAGGFIAVDKEMFETHYEKS